MSLLTPLYLLGLAAVSLPIVFHLIRRTPRGRQVFSSLMFLAPSPPRLTRRSRIEQWLLLLLRAAALILLALAFARPFLRETAILSLEGIRGRKVAILLDTSASMRRANLWQQAMTRLKATLDELDPADDVALITVDHQVQPIVDFDTEPNPNQPRKPDLIRGRLAELAPSWSHTDLGRGLTALADALAVRGDQEQSPAVLQIVLISDMQQGADLKALQAFDWPSEVLVSIETVAPTDPSNASLRVLTADEESAEEGMLRVRITNAADSTAEQFQVGWGPDAVVASPAVYVPAGQSRVVQIPPADVPGSDHLVLRGDAEDFDNRHFIVPRHQDQVEVLYVGSDDAQDPNGLQYYLRMALAETRHRRVNVTARAPDEPLALRETDSPRLVVVTAAVDSGLQTQLLGYLERGGLVLAVPVTPEAGVSLARLAPQLEHLASPRGTPEDGYRMLSDIDFTHPLFAVFANPRYSDFTKIHFWNHQRFAIRDESAVRVLARFDNGDPALWEHAIAAGKLMVMASGWHPDDSQLALSSKFVPLLNTLLDQAAGSPVEMPSFTVQDTVPLPQAVLAYTLALPDGTSFPITPAMTTFRQTDQPGIYSAQRSATPFEFAVNLASAESDTAMMDLEQLEQLGVRLGAHRTQAEESDVQRQLRDIELESKQQLWRWLLVIVLSVLALETWLAGRRARAVTRHDGESA